MAYYPYSPNFSDIYTLTNSDGITAVFNDQGSPYYVGMLTEVTGLDSADVRESADDLVEADGGQHGYFWLGRRPIVLNGRVFGHATARERAARLDLGRRASFALRKDSTLSWKPAVRQDNLLVNPSFESGITNWTAVGVTTTFAQQSAWASSGANSLRWTANPAAGVFPGVDSDKFPVIAGQSYGLAGAMNVVTNQANGLLPKFRWFNASNVEITQSTGAVISGTGVKAPSLVATAPAGAVTACVRFITNGSAGVHDFYLDAVIASPGSTVPVFFDGNTAGYYWQGNANTSASGDYIEMFTPVRRQQPWRETGGWNKDFQCALVSQYAPLFSVAQKSVTAALAVGASVENRGNYPGYPVVRITGGNLANPTVTRAGGEVFSMNGTGLTLAAGETVEVDFLNHTATFIAGARNGQSANRYINFATTAWPCTVSGTSTFTLGGTGTGSMTVLWRDSWA